MSIQQTALGYAQLPAVLIDRCIKSLRSSSVFIFLMVLLMPGCDFSNRDTTKSSSSTAVLPCGSSSRCRLQPPRPSFFVAELLREESPLASLVHLQSTSEFVSKPYHDSISNLASPPASPSCSSSLSSSPESVSPSRIRGSSSKETMVILAVLHKWSSTSAFLQIGPKPLNIQK
ncbi:hypothetical protein Bca4012_026482 [Brassica carinata]|uniref:Uncharacterized protein n=1 Tax=Brassica carinata TaxID=52824 RepID=A0A8X7VIU5_BRACI|nr:hypothetical protein Bca52824_023518 [Brassica carinata]